MNIIFLYETVNHDFFKYWDYFWFVKVIISALVTCRPEMYITEIKGLDTVLYIIWKDLIFGDFFKISYTDIKWRIIEERVKIDGDFILILGLFSDVQCYILWTADQRAVIYRSDQRRVNT